MYVLGEGVVRSKMGDHSQSLFPLAYKAGKAHNSQKDSEKQEILR